MQLRAAIVNFVILYGVVHLRLVLSRLQIFASETLCGDTATAIAAVLSAELDSKRSEQELASGERGQRLVGSLTGGQLPYHGSGAR
jgi:hypothetical protein